MNQLMTPPRNSMNQKDPLSFSNRPAHADPRDLHRPQVQSSGKSPSRLLSYGITSRGTRITEKQKRTGLETEGRKKKGITCHDLLQKGEKKYPSDGRRERTREGDFHLSSTRLTGLRCLHRVTGWAGRGEARERTGSYSLPLSRLIYQDAGTTNGSGGERY